MTAAVVAAAVAAVDVAHMVAGVVVAGVETCCRCSKSAIKRSIGLTCGQFDRDPLPSYTILRMVRAMPGTKRSGWRLHLWF